VLEQEVAEGTYIPSRRERDRDTLRSEPQISSEEIAPFVQRSCKRLQSSKEPLRFREIKLRRRNAS
jgi:hypothetical protein